MTKATTAAVHQLLGQHLHLLAEKAIFWEEQKCLLLADIHLGKAGHFRKAGMPVPTTVHAAELQVLSHLITRYGAERLIVLGDLFHSSYNSEMHMFSTLQELHPTILFQLVPGNHDKHAARALKQVVEVLSPETEVGPFLLLHEPLQKPHPHLYGLSGHVHPSVVMQGKGRNRLQLPCFWFGQHQGLLPAFGTFTGMAKLRPTANECIYVTTGRAVIRAGAGKAVAMKG